jgi:CRP/FNR family transcriptional regulator, cyclic AMP receptor protein
MSQRLSKRKQRVLVALYESGAVGRRSARSVRSLVETGGLDDSRYAGPLAALEESGLVASERELAGRSSSTSAWWLTGDGRALAEALGPGRSHEGVQLLEADRELADALEAEALVEARSRSFAEVVSLDAGDWAPEASAEDLQRGLGLLVLCGLLSRQVRLKKRTLLELLGPGDLLRPWTHEAEPLASASPRVSWQALTPTKLAVLDRRFALRMAGWPEILGVLLDRAVQRSRTLAVQSAIRQAGDVEERIWLTLWHLAHRWGTRGGEGIVLTLPDLTTDVFARIAAARPASATQAVRRLTDRGLIEPLDDGTWLLRQGPALPTARTM